MQEYDYGEDEFEQSGGGKWIRIIGIIVYMAIIIAYAIQTLQLVSWLFPSSNVFMKAVTVFVCDGCATGYAMAEMFYRFKLRNSKQLVFGMWIITFVLSTAATVIQMYLSSTNNIPHSIDTTVISIAYGVVIVAYVVNIIAITVIIRNEHNAGKPQHRYLDDGKSRRRMRSAQQANIRIAHLPQDAHIQEMPGMRELFEKANANPEGYTRWYAPSRDPEARNAAIRRGEYIPGMYIEPVGYDDGMIIPNQPVRSNIPSNASPLAPAPNNQNGATQSNGHNK